MRFMSWSKRRPSALAAERGLARLPEHVVPRTLKVVPPLAPVADEEPARRFNDKRAKQFMAKAVESGLADFASAVASLPPGDRHAFKAEFRFLDDQGDVVQADNWGSRMVSELKLLVAYESKDPQAARSEHAVGQLHVAIDRAGMRVHSRDYDIGPRPSNQPQVPLQEHAYPAGMNPVEDLPRILSTWPLDRVHAGVVRWNMAIEPADAVGVRGTTLDVPVREASPSLGL